MTTIVSFRPSPAANFQFQASLDGSTYTITVIWNLSGQRWYINVTDSQNQLIVSLPMIASPDNFNIDLLAGYFTTVLVFRQSSQQFEIDPAPPSVITPITTLVAPLNLVAVGGPRIITWSWGLVKGASAYNLYWANRPGVTPLNGIRIPNIQTPYAQSVDGNAYITVAIVGGQAMVNVIVQGESAFWNVSKTPYYGVVTAVRDDSEGPPSNQASASAL